MTYTGPNATEAVQAIQDQVLGYKDRGYAVDSPGSTVGTGSYAVTVNTGTLDATDTLSVGSANDEIIFNGASASLSAATDIGIDSVPTAGDGTKQYRYDTIWADANGEVNITKGTVTKVPTIESQNNLTRFERLKADIPLPGTWPSVVICAVVTNSDDTTVGSSQLRDYRVDATQKVKALEADSLTLAESATRVALSAPQTISSDTSTKIQFDNVIGSDNLGIFDSINHEFVIDKPGVYAVTLRLRFQSLSSGTSVLATIKQNGNTVGLSRLLIGGFETVTLTTIDQFAASDSIYALVQQDSGADADLNTPVSDTEFSITRLG